MYVWSCVYGTTSVVSAVACLNAAAQDVMGQEIPSRLVNSKSEFTHWYSSFLMYYIRGETYFYRRKKERNLTTFTNIFLHIMLLKLLFSLTDLAG
jgi:hypothetical protein